ncbi:hypothetical protein [Rhizorhabdus wittichii]|uniref:hypothetical protein n=1 Tax=Rhizorhabdus wittichii TaxID=160791 RepID=UPI0012FDFA84|nr:hypothetical protein [Rhizorhabdus wittichii]
MDKRPTPALDRFADLIAAGVSVPDAAEMMGHPRRYGRDLLGKLRKRLGAQAV